MYTANRKPLQIMQTFLRGLSVLDRVAFSHGGVPHGSDGTSTSTLFNGGMIPGRKPAGDEWGDQSQSREVIFLLPYFDGFTFFFACQIHPCSLPAGFHCSPPPLRAQSWKHSSSFRNEPMHCRYLVYEEVNSILSITRSHTLAIYCSLVSYSVTRGTGM